ncbi:MAG: hypothetical protein K0U86_14265 [Planctomycetes bacterium]|nr:hypothetical protein [Planctomycetota bacterium]MCH9726059.1 hypothetical protein [Planctomycetota bacterium]MCH9777211.1 hypothetical protein [Planctomycetota bacterium]MCH9790494.1 hypothetical protein [Planctomycetota bacterium]MDF1742327.1 hypothetical protein [Gimesia sp.]
MDQDKKHLKRLSQIQILYGILNLFVSYFYYQEIFVLVDGYRKDLEKNNPEVQVALLIGFGFILFLIGIAILFCIILAGQSLALYENYTLCLVVAIAECLIVPIGTIIGVYTIIILRRDSVKKLFAMPKEESGSS